MASLDAALGRLRDLPAGSPKAEALLRTANVGRYWDEHGAISGMLFAYGIHSAFGVEGVREAIRCGPASLLHQYAAATSRLADLPRLPPGIASWPDLIDLC